MGKKNVGSRFDDFLPDIVSGFDFSPPESGPFSGPGVRGSVFRFVGNQSLNHIGWRRVQRGFGPA